MPSLYKYLPEQYVKRFIRNGEVLFRSLSYFRDFEDQQVRGDQFEGKRSYHQQKGLEGTMIPTNEKRLLQYKFESTANSDDIFVFCLSNILSPNLACTFNVSTCIEIHRPELFISKIHDALHRRPSIKDKTLIHEQVKYYDEADPPIAEWALPDRIVLSKLLQFKRQEEYRIAFAIRDAFRVNNTQVQLVPINERRVPRIGVHSQRLLKLGTLTKICKIHCFG